MAAAPLAVKSGLAERGAKRFRIGIVEDEPLLFLRLRAALSNVATLAHDFKAASLPLRATSARR
jgi:hypothetical protein